MRPHRAGLPTHKFATRCGRGELDHGEVVGGVFLVACLQGSEFQVRTMPSLDDPASHFGRETRNRPDVEFGDPVTQLLDVGVFGRVPERAQLLHRGELKND